MAYIKDIYHDEVRSGFLVTTDRKKLWERLLEIWHVFDGICQKHKIPYFADSGTLLGAVRHQGFVPWDDDLDFVMFRPDYERFQEVALREVKPPYFLQNTYTDGWVLAWSKLRDSRTAAIEWPNAANVNQGIFIDIIPLDHVSDGSPASVLAYKLQYELWGMVIQPDTVKELMKNGESQLGEDIIRPLLEKSLEERMKIYEGFMLDVFPRASKISFFMSDMVGRYPGRDISWYGPGGCMPFEQVQLPVPSGYDAVLRNFYGDYSKLVRGTSLHEGMLVSTDITYEDLIKEIAWT